MKCGIMTLTPGGIVKACQIANHYEAAKIYTISKHLSLLKSSYNGSPEAIENNCLELIPNMKSVLQERFYEMDVWIMIMATGIVVRTCGALAINKQSDPAVLVVDEKGAYVISLLSGHLGGANQFAKSLAYQIGAQPIITTASDVVGVPAMDLLAKKWGCHISDMTAVKEATAGLVAGNTMEEVQSQWITAECPPLLVKDLVIGIGCKRGKTKLELEKAIRTLLAQAQLPIERVSALASVTLKSDEQGLLELASEKQWALRFYSPQLLNTVASNFSESTFVKETIGVGNVHQTAGYIGSGLGIELNCNLKESGITLSLWQKRPRKPAFLLAGTHSGVGKTTLTMGILAALTQKYKVQSYKVGPDYIDPSFHSKITGQPCINLDTCLTSPVVANYLYERRSTSADIHVVEGVMGLFDGRGLEGQGSSAELSKILNIPVVLVVDGSGIANSIAALVSGYAHYDREVQIQGIIINRVQSQKHYELLKEIIEVKTGIPCFGYLSKSAHVALPSRHLGLLPSQEIVELEALTQKLSEMIEKTIDLEGLVKMAASEVAPIELIQLPERSLQQPSFIQPLRPNTQPIRIAVAFDEAFHFYYEDNLELLRSYGAELAYFSPIHDQMLPDNCCGIYLGGGFPEVFAERLSENRGLRNQLNKLFEQGMPCYAECGGYMYVNQSITDLEGKTYEMVGWLDHKIEMTNKLKHFGYKTLTLQENTLLGAKGEQVTVHEFHHSQILEEDDQEPMQWAYQLNRNGQISNGGCYKGHVLGGYPHIHFYGNPQMAENFVAACRKYCLRSTQ